MKNKPTGKKFYRKKCHFMKLRNDRYWSVFRQVINNIIINEIREC